MTKFKYFLLLLITVGLMVSCSSTDENLRAMIPDDAVGVVGIDVPAVLKKSGMSVNEGTVAIPDSLKKVIDDGDPNIFSDIIGNLPKSGFDFTNRCYIFLSPGIFNAVALFPLVDEEKAATMVAKIASGKMKDVAGVKFASHLDHAYAIDNDVLLVGRCSNVVAPEVAAKAAADILDKSKPSLMDNDEVVKAIDSKEGDVNAYVDVKSLGALIKSDSKLNMFKMGAPVIDIIAGTDIKAVTASIKFDKSKKDGETAKVKTKLIYDENSQYSQLYDKVIASKASNSSSVLGLIPGELSTYVGIKINGSNLVQMPQIQEMLKMLDGVPFTKGLNYNDILGSLNGAFVIGAGEATTGGYNFVIGTQSSNPTLIINQIIDLGSQRGQEPLLRDGEYFYDYGSQGIAVGQSENAFYLRCVDFGTQYTAQELPVLPDNLDKCAVVVFKFLKLGDKPEGFFNWGLKDKSSGEGFYFAEDEKANVVVSLLKLLCWKEPGTSSDEDDNVDYGF